jgi:RHS repeat-associated protein
MRLLIRTTLMSLAIACIGMALLPSGAAASECTDTWTGPSEGNWGAAASWSTEEVPTSADIVCIGTGKTVNVTTGTNEAGILLVEGSLSVAGGSLHVSEVPSTVANLRILGGVLDSEGEVYVLKSLVANGGSMEGSGSTVIGAEASGKVESGGGLTIVERALENYGELTVEGPEGRIVAEQGAAIDNAGTLTVNAEGAGNGLAVGGPGPAPTLTNTGVLKKAESESEGSKATLIGLPIDNEGLVETESGVLELTGGGVSGKSAESHWIAFSENLWRAHTKLVFAEQSYHLGNASITGEAQLVSGAAVTANRVEGSEGSVWLYGGDFQLAGGNVTKLGELGIAGGMASIGAGSELSAETLELTTEYLEESGVEEVEDPAEVVVGPNSTVNLKFYLYQDLGTVQLGNKTTFNARLYIEGGTFTAGDETTFAGREFFLQAGSFIAGESTNFLIEEPFVSGGAFESGPHSTISGDYFFQESGSTTLGAHTSISGEYFFQEEGTTTLGAHTSITELEYMYMEEGSLTFGEDTTATMSEMFYQQGGEAVFDSGSVLEVGEFIYFQEGTTTIGPSSVIKANEIVFDEVSAAVETNASIESNELYLYDGELTGPGSAITNELKWYSTIMSGSGLTEVREKGLIDNGESCGKTCTPIPSYAQLDQRRLITRGTFSLGLSTLVVADGARIDNYGEFNASSEDTTHGPAQLAVPESSEIDPKFVNYGEFNKETGSGTTFVTVPFESFGSVHQDSGTLLFSDPIGKIPSDLFGFKCHCGDPVEPSTGNFAETQTDLSIGGRGIGLDLSRSYSVYAATTTASAGMFGYGWSSSFSDHLSVVEGGEGVTVVGADGSAVPFHEDGEGGFEGPIWSQASLSGSAEAGFTFIPPDQLDYRFSGSGQLESITDRNGNETTLAYNEAGRLEAVTDPSERQIHFAYNGEGLVESAEDPMGHLVEYGYEGKELATVTLPGEEAPNWIFKYDGSHRMTSMTDGRGGKTTIEYDEANRVISQTDPAKRTLSFEYEPFHTRITNETTGSVTDLWFTSNNEPFSITDGYGTPEQTTETLAYDEAGHLLKKRDGNGHATTYAYNPAGDRTGVTDGDENKTKWEYNGTHDLISETTPNGETTTIERDAAGNPETIARPAPEAKTQTTSFEYTPNGDLESMTDPLERTWHYEYDSFGDRKASIDPLGDKATFGYDEDSRLVSRVSPRGYEVGAEAAEFTTRIERDPQGRPEEVIDPLGETTKVAYDPTGNLEARTDANGHTTEYSYNADDEPIETKRPTGAVLKTEYDGAGQVIAQIDGNEHATTYVRNALGQAKEIIDPLSRKTIQTFDGAGNLKTVSDPAKRVTTYTYDPADRLEEVAYSEEATPDVHFEYDPDGNTTKMVDGSGESTYGYDQLDRLTETTNGHGQSVEYSYNLADEPEQITYPNGKSVAQAFDQAGRLESVTDWLSKTTRFEYDADSNVESVHFPAATGNVDQFSYDRSDRTEAVDFKKGAEVLASLAYERDELGQLEAMSSAGLPGPEEEGYEYDEDNRLTKAGSDSFEYDPADNLIETPTSTNAFDGADQLESGTGLTYKYDEMGERIKATPGAGPATTYTYDQAADLTSVKRPKEGEVPAIDEAFGYDGQGLLASQKLGETTRYLSWDTSTSLPLLLSDGQNSYIYGPTGLPVEQISSVEVPSFYHHDQLGSTRMLTNSSGEQTATFTYGSYGGLEASTGSQTTPLGFAGQYTESQSGLQYLRARFYDSATGQFLTKDPLVVTTGQPYSYALDNPLNLTDPSGQFGEGAAACAATAEVPGVDVATCGAAAGEAAVVAVLIACTIFGCEETINAPNIHTAAEDTEYNEEAHEECPLESQDERETRLRREGEERLGNPERHSPAGKERWQEWWRGLPKSDRKAYDRGGGPRPRKRNN